MYFLTEICKFSLRNREQRSRLKISPLVPPLIFWWNLKNSRSFFCLNFRTLLKICLLNSMSLPPPLKFWKFSELTLPGGMYLHELCLQARMPRLLHAREGLTLKISKIRGGIKFYLVPPWDFFPTKFSRGATPQHPLWASLLISVYYSL
jgi:hypothetical protein